MAIFSLNHKSIGKSTQDRPYTASAHIHYVARPRAVSRLDGARMPISKNGAAGFFRQEEDRARANGRVADKVMLALPRELTPEQRAQLVRGYAEEITQGRAPWLAAFHDKGKDARNPHCHLVVRDRDPETGRRVYGMSEKGSTQRLRTLWEQHTNRALEVAKRPERVDSRSLEAQGKGRQPGIHVGPRSRAMHAAGRAPVSRRRSYTNGLGARRRRREVDYPRLDRGRSRTEFNASRLAPMTEREGWEAIDADRQRRELETLRAIHHPPIEKGGAQMSPITSGTNPQLKKEKAAAKMAKPAKKARAPNPEKASSKKDLEKAPMPSLDFLRPETVAKTIPKAPAATLDFLKPATPAKGVAKAPMPNLQEATRAVRKPSQDKDLSRKR